MRPACDIGWCPESGDERRLPPVNASHRLILVLVLAACDIRDRGPVDSATLRHGPAGPALEITILGDERDPRMPAAREAIEHWNAEFKRLDRRLRFDTVGIRPDSIPDTVVRAAQNEAVIGGGPATSRLLSNLSATPGDVVIILTQTDLISFSVPLRRGSKGVVAVRRGDIWPLTLPNTARNVIAHEMGHVLGLSHNTDSTTLMCGRPASCRPAAFTSESARFFPLTSADEQRIVARWP